MKDDIEIIDLKVIPKVGLRITAKLTDEDFKTIKISQGLSIGGIICDEPPEFKVHHISLVNIPLHEKHKVIK